MSDLSYESFLIEELADNYKGNGGFEKKSFEKIGSGRFGSVFSATNKKDGIKYAIREINAGANKKSTHDFLREVELYIQVKAHPCICKFYGFSMSAPQRIVLEYLENGSLKTIFDKLLTGEKVDYWNGTMKSKTVFGIAAALLHLQNQNAVHRFLTPSSILFDSKKEPRLCDFAYAKVDTGEGTHQTMVGSKNVQIYQAPELDDSTDYNYLVDNYSYGVILYQIVTGKEAFNSKGSNYKVKKDIHDGVRPPIPMKECPKLARMIGDLWSNNPDNRPEFIDILKSLNDYDEPLFPGTNMDQYKQYRKHIIESSYLTDDQLSYLYQPQSTEEEVNLFERYLDNANKGDVKNMVKTARCYEQGVGVDIDKESAIEWYRKAAEKNDPESLYKLANFYCLGVPDILDKNEAEYVKFLLKAADLQYPFAKIDYGVILKTGNSGVKKDIDKAEKILKEMSNDPNNYGEAQYFLAQLYEEKGQPEQAILYYNKARDNGIEGAHCDYALMLLDGRGIEMNQEEGLKILKQAAYRGFPMANYNLGFIYETGRYLKDKNPEKAFELYKTAAENGLPAAMVKVGKALFKGALGTFKCERDPIRAARLFERAAEKGDLEGLHSWGTFLNNYVDLDDYEKKKN